MGQMIRCPLIGISCSKPITVEGKTFFLAEAEKPDDVRKRRKQAISVAIAGEYNIRSSLDEKGINAFTCKICEMIQTCAYGMADISDNNPNVLFELGIMIALGKPTVILLKKDQELGLKLPSDLNAIEIIPFTEYIDVIEQLREVVAKLPAVAPTSSPIQDLEKILPGVAEEVRKAGTEIVKEFRESMEQAKLDTISFREEKKEIPPELDARLKGLEERLENMSSLGFVADANTALLRGNYFYDQRKYDEALASYNRSLELGPDDPDTLYNRGLTSYKLERYTEALVDYNRSLELRPDDPHTLTNQGLTYHYLERYDEALANYNRSLGLSPDEPITLYNRGNTYYELERYAEALADYNRSLELGPDDPDTLTNRGLTYYNLGQYDESLADFNRSLELKPDDPGTIYDLACLFSIQRKANDAVKYLRKTISKDKKYLEMAKIDKDFDNIRNDPRFKKLIESG